MFQFPLPKLGETGAFIIAVQDTERSASFYNLLGFSKKNSSMRGSSVQMTDGALLLMLKEHKVPFFAAGYFVSKMDEAVKVVKDAGVKMEENDMFDKAVVFCSPDQLPVVLMPVDEAFEKPSGLTMLTMKQDEIFDPEKYTNKSCGLFGELAHPVKDLEISIAFWELLGYTVLTKFESPYSWAILSDGVHVLGLHQTQNVNYPAITFFASDMKDKIESLKQKGITDYTYSGSGNIILNTPEKQHINLFRLGA